MSYVLVIDDEISITKMLNVALTTAGYKVDVASSGEEGVEKYDRGCFDVVITDVKMPGISGNEVVQYIRNSTKPDTPIVGISGTPWELNEDFNAVLPKPFSLSSLYNVIQKVRADNAL